MNKYYSILFISVFFLQVLQAQEEQLNIGFESNAQYYVDDEVTGDFDENDPFRSNNYLKVEYGYKKFTAGIQIEGYTPQRLLSYSPSYDDPVNIATYHLAYQNGKWLVDAGYFYEQFGSGLVLRAWEDRQLGINNALRGLKIKHTFSDRLSLTALWGQQRQGFKVSDGSIFGLNGYWDLSKGDHSLQLELSYAGRYDELPDDGNGLSPLTHNSGLSVQYAKGGFYTNIEGVVKSKDALVEDGNILTDKTFYGNALQIETGYSRKGFGMNINLRRMENMNFYTDRYATGNTYNELIVNYLPALTKIHDYLLSNIYVYQAQPAISFYPLQKAGEIGGQIDLYYKIKKGTPLGGKYGTKIAANFSNWYGLKADYIPEFRRIHVYALGAGEEYFRDANIEIRKKIDKKTHLTLTYIDSYYNKTYIEEREGNIHARTAIADVTYKFGKSQSIRADLQHLWTRQDMKNWAAGTLEYNAGIHWSFFINDMYNYGNDEPSHRNHYYNIGGSYTRGTGRYAVSYGRTRGGLLCVGGVCREVPAATGLTLNISKSF